MINNPAGVLAVLTGVAALFFYLEQRYEWRLFRFLPPLLFIYALPVVLSNTGVIPNSSPAYDGMRRYGLPFFLTLLLTQPMSNQAAAVVVVPVAIQTALQLDLNPRTFAIMIAVGASCSFITPLEPACLMVYGPGRYRFADFIKVGSILTVLVYILAILPLGIWLSFLSWKVDGIVPGMVCHWLNNVVAFSILAFAPGLEAVDGPLAWAVDGALIASLVAAVAVLLQNSPKVEQAKMQLAG